MSISYFDFRCIISNAARVHADGEAEENWRLWSLAFKLDRDIRDLFPYINGSLDDALWYERPEHVKFLFEEYRCFLYPEQAAAHFFESRAAAQAFAGRFTDFLNSIEARKVKIRPSFDRVRQVQVMDILRLLPGTNCRACGFSTCMAFAAALARGRALADACPHLVAPMSEAAVYPILDSRGNLVDTISLPINTVDLKNRIQVQEDRIRSLEERLGTADTAVPLSPPPVQSEFHLTEREIQVVELIAQGYTNNEIGNQLFISPHTVKSHMINIFNKLNVCDRTQAAVLACRSGLI